MNKNRQITGAIAIVVVSVVVIWGGWRTLRGSRGLDVQPQGEKKYPRLIASVTPGASLPVASDELPDSSSPDTGPEPTQAFEETASIESTAVERENKVQATTVPPGESDSTATVSVSTSTVSEPTATVTVGTTAPQDRPSPTLVAPDVSPTEGVVAPLPTPAGRLAPNTAAGPLQFQQIRIFSSPETGTFAGYANVTNIERSFLNGLAISWRVLGEEEQVLDEGEISWPNLAPGETVTLHLMGSKPFVDSWIQIRFDFSP